MKKLFFLSFISFCLLLCKSKTFGQWQLTGNSNAIATSILGTTNAIPLNLTTNNVQRLVIDANGKIGIGTATPVNILTVKGAGSTPAPSWVAAGAPLFVGFGETTVGNADYILAMASTSNNGRPVFVGRRSRGTLAVPTAMANNDFIVSMLASAHDGTAFQNPAAIDFLVDGSPSAGNVPARISFVTGSNSTNRAERLKIGNTGDITMNTNQLFLQQSTGFLGVGTTAPAAQLQLGNTVVNRKLVLFDIANNDHQFYGFGVNNGTLRYQVDATSASHVFYAGTGTSTSSELMRIQGNGNVGIGTTAPAAKLDVAGNVKIADGTQGIGRILTSDANGLATWQLPSGGSGQWTTTGNNIYSSNSGNVGIGTTTPQARLHVVGVGRFEDGVKVGGFGIVEVDAPGIIAGRLKIDSTGRVGIGTATPTSKLDVNGQLTIEQKNFGGSGGLLIKGDAPGSSYPNIAFSVKNDAPTPADVIAGFIQGVITNKTANSESMDLGLYTSQAGYAGLAARVYIKDNGNVGIGTSTPNNKLNLNGGNMSIYNGDNVTDAGGSLEFGVSALPTSTPMSSVKGVLANSTGSELQGGIAFSTRPLGAAGQLLTEKMRIQNDGNVGIGTSTPFAPITVVTSTTGVVHRGIWSAQHAGAQDGAIFGGQRSRGTEALPTAVGSGDYGAAFISEHYDGTNYLLNGSMGYRITGAATAGNVPGEWFFGASNTNDVDAYTNGHVRMVIQSAGNVGIGTTAPAAKLDIAGNVKIADGTQGVGRILTSDANGLATWQLPSGGSGQWTTTGNNIYSSNSGNVGIGTTTPGYRLQVVGVGRFEDGVKVGGLGIVEVDAPGKTAGRLKIDSTGRVGIGTATPTSKLDVNGQVTIDQKNFGGYGGLLIKGNIPGNAHPNIAFTVKNNAGTPLDVVAGLVQGELSNNVSGSEAMGLGFYTSQTGQGGLAQRLLIKDNGNVGIATNTPSAKLEVDGAILGLGAQATHINGAWLEWNKDGGSGRTYLLNQKGGGVGGIVFGEVSTANVITERMMIDANGNVGIGTSTPNNKLNVDGGNMSVYNGGNVTDAGGSLEFGVSALPTYGAMSSVKGVLTNSAGTELQGGIAFSTRPVGAAGQSLTEKIRIQSNGNVGIGTSTPNGLFELKIDQGLKPSTSTWTITSDARLKNIEGTYTKGLAEILKLNPITYHYKNAGNRKFDEKVIASLSVGFTAQEVQKVFPEAVGTDPDGYLNLNIHPILIASINAFKEQQKQIETLSGQVFAKDETIQSLQHEVAAMRTQMNEMMRSITSIRQSQEACCNVSQTKPANQNETVENVETPVLEQNAPNPVSNTTVIRYKLPSTVREAQIIITDSKGTNLKSIKLIGKPIGQVTLSAGTLAPGTYFYTLIADSKKADTKEMQIVR